MKRILIVALLLAALTGSAAAQKVSAVATASTPFSGSDFFYLVQGGVSKKTTMALLTQQVALNIALTNGITQLTGDCAAGPGSGAVAIACTKTGGLAFGALATTTPGTGVATALGVNVGTAGSLVVNGGALGTPSSGVATGLTGTAAGLTAGTVTTNANLTGPVTSTGNATAIAAGAIALSKIGGEVDGDCIVGAGGVWIAGACSAGGSVSVTAATPDTVITPSPGLTTFTVGSTMTQNAPADGGSHSYTVLSSDITKQIALVGTFTALVVPQATGAFGAGTQFTVCNAGSVTATSTTSTINGIAGATGIKLGPLSCSKWITSSGQWVVQMGLPTDPTQRSTYYLAGDNQFRDTAAITGLPNAALTNSAVTINTHSLALGGALTLAFSDFAGTVAAGQLPNPSASTLGGVQSKAAVSNQWINSISTSGVPSTTQPACTNLSDATSACSGSAAGLTAGTLPQARLGASQTSCTPTDASGATLTFTSVSCHYDQIGNIVFIYFQLTYPSTVNGSAAKLGGLPVTVANANYAAVGQACIANAGANTPVLAQFVINTTTVLLLKPTSASILNSDLSTDTVRCAIWYPAA